MWHDVVDLRDFYETQLGAMARRMIRRGIRAMWPDVKGQRVLGLGYATPYLRQFLTEAERTLAFMPASKGVLHWPSEGRGLTALVDETEFPLPDLSIDRVLLVHGLESSEYQSDMLREAWRVLTGEGRLLIVAPNRSGIWARLERTPLGWGQPYSAAQLSRLLRDNMFTPTRSNRALYIPPLRTRALLRSAPAWERIGSRWFPTFGGVVLVEAGKQLYASNLQAERKRFRRPIVVSFPRPVRPATSGGAA
ncbi:MAG: methyltransferase domain-containing protein [Proteobacteria bacterium]|nr:methyltransferase domain-containing protein [Pseudomonadota bacterium]MCH8997474.1 methyltransferase domain-containing protein [Pseudomonadota bacterium]